MSKALIGYTGFVGSNIEAQTSFDHFYNSKNIADIADRTFDLVVCAGVPAVKWWANQNPEKDKVAIHALAERFRSVNAKRFVLISTVDVYPKPFAVDENTEIDLEVVDPYGKHRLMLERELKDSFEHFHVARLPGLFGKGLKKNILFDMLCNNMLEKINLQSSFQWYPLSRIWKDIQKVIDADLPLVNFAVEPVVSQTIKDRFFSDLTVGTDPLPEAHYDMYSQHAKVLAPNQEHYLMSAKDVLAEMENWLKEPGLKRG